MRTKGQQILIQMSVVLAIAAVTAGLVAVWKLDVISSLLLGDPKPAILNGIILLLFALGIGQLYRVLLRCTWQEQQINEYVYRREDGETNAVIFEELPRSALIAERYLTIRSLFERGVPIDHGAISAIMVAEESQHQTFPRFVNNVLILTGVFGTVTSLIFALIGASEVLQATVPGEGMGTVLLGMNTALTTTATAIVCYFFFTFFYQRLTDVQTHLFSRIEQAVLIHIVPDFAFESDTVDHQTKLLIEDVRVLVDGLRAGVGGIERVVATLGEQRDTELAQWRALASGHEQQQEAIRAVMERLDRLHETLNEGFRLR